MGRVRGQLLGPVDVEARATVSFVTTLRGDRCIGPIVRCRSRQTLLRPNEGTPKTPPDFAGGTGKPGGSALDVPVGPGTRPADAHTRSAESSCSWVRRDAR